MPQTIVGPIQGLEHEGPDKLRNRPIIVHFPGDVTARLRTDNKNFDLYAGILEAIKGCHGGPCTCQAYVELDFGSREISRLLLPRVGNVTHVSLDVPFGATFLLDNSSRVFHIPGSHPRYREYLGMLSDAITDWGALTVTEDESCREIVDLCPAPNPNRPLPKKCSPGPIAFPAPLQWNELMDCLDLVSGAACPSAGPYTCIPFQFPDDGCVARAHQMCRILRDSGKQPGKAWNFPIMGQTLVVRTTNSPHRCQVQWPYHVAALLYGYAEDGSGPQPMILDPSLFPYKPAKEADWIALQVGSDPAKLLHTPMDPYLPPTPKYCLPDSDFSCTECDLVCLEQNFKMRVGACGPPPYDCSQDCSDTLI